MNQKGFSLILIVFGLILVIGIAGGAYYLGASKNQQAVNRAQTQNPIISSQVPQPSLTPSPIPTPSRNENVWQNYSSGQNIDGITINYPKGWKINFKKEYNLGPDYKAKYRIDFDFAPPDWNSSGSTDWLGWGMLNFDVYDRQATIDQWIDKYSPDSKEKLIVKEDTMIGGKPTFKVYSDVSQFNALVIFGNTYTYDLSHSQNGSADFVKAWNNKSEIFPYIQID